MDKCHISSKSILSHSKMRYQLNCISLSSEEINDIQDNQQVWFCSPCIAEVFPFNHIEDDVEFVATIEDITVSGTAMSYLSEKVFIPFELNNKDHSSLLCDSGPHLLCNNINDFLFRAKFSYSKLVKRGYKHNLLLKYFKKFCSAYNIEGKYGEKNSDLLFSRMLKHNPFVSCNINNTKEINDIVKASCVKIMPLTRSVEYEWKNKSPLPTNVSFQFFGIIVTLLPSIPAQRVPF